MLSALIFLIAELYAKQSAAAAAAAADAAAAAAAVASLNADAGLTGGCGGLEVEATGGVELSKVKVESDDYPLPVQRDVSVQRCTFLLSYSMPPLLT